MKRYLLFPLVFPVMLARLLAYRVRNREFAKKLYQRRKLERVYQRAMADFDELVRLGMNPTRAESLVIARFSVSQFT